MECWEEVEDQSFCLFLRVGGVYGNGEVNIYQKVFLN